MFGDMNFEYVLGELTAQGWFTDGQVLRSPSGGFWFDQSTFERDVRAVYYPAARRVWTFGCPPHRHELHALLAVLQGVPLLASLNANLIAVHAQLKPFAERHAMTLASWAFGYPSVRATARHPSRGVAVLEAVLEHPPLIDFSATHWFDDPVRHRRFSRHKRFAILSHPIELHESLGAGLMFLLQSPHLDLFEISALAGSAREQHGSRAEWWRTFSTLCE